MKSRTTDTFWERYAVLPAHVQRQADEAYALFVENPYHPSLRFKQVHADPPIYSARVGIGYRAVGVRKDGTMVWYWVGTHAEYDQLLKRF